SRRLRTAGRGVCPALGSTAGVAHGPPSPYRCPFGEVRPMIKHILRALWHRRRSEALVVVEVLATFLVIAMVAAFATMLGSRARLPLGFDADRVLRIEVVGVGDSGEQ